MHRSECKLTNRGNRGPAGIKCRCCRPMYSKQDSRRFVNQWVRRKYKELIRKIRNTVEEE